MLFIDYYSIYARSSGSLINETLKQLLNEKLYDV